MGNTVFYLGSHKWVKHQHRLQLCGICSTISHKRYTTLHAPMSSYARIDNPSEYLTTLPLLNHDAAIKWAKIQHTGIGHIFVFYSQMLNALEQFSIFLIPLNQVMYNTSLCPLYHIMILLITACCYQSMAKHSTRSSKVRTLFL
jgi:hypothetical protein